MAVAPPNEVFSAAAFIGFILVCIPLPWHLHAGNIGTCLYIMWTALACLNQFINSVIWNKHAINLAPVWCDISSRLVIGVAVAIPASSLCIIHRLYRISQMRVVTTPRTEKHREIMIDLSIGLGIPIVQMAVQIVVEGHRFDVFQEIGCMPFTYNVTLAYPLVWAWPLCIGLVTSYYAIRCLITFCRRQSEFAQLLASGSSLDTNRYLRLMMLSGLQATLTVPLSIYVIIVNAHASNVEPWISWEETHFGYSRVDEIPKVLWKGTLVESGLESGRWLNVVCAFIFFAFFGSGSEAMKHYKKYYENVRRIFGIGRKKCASGKDELGHVHSGVLPIYIRREKITKRSSMDTFASSIRVETKNDTTVTAVDCSNAEDQVSSLSRSTSLPETPLIPSFLAPGKDTTSPQRSTTIKTAVSTLTVSSLTPSSATHWSRASATLSQAELFIAEDPATRVDGRAVEKELPPFPRSPTIGDGSSVWLARTNTIKSVAILRPPPSYIRRSPSPPKPTYPIRPPPPFEIKISSHSNSFLDLSSSP